MLNKKKKRKPTSTTNGNLAEENMISEGSPVIEVDADEAKAKKKQTKIIKRK